MKTDAGTIDTLLAVLISIVLNSCAGLGNAQLSASEKMMWSTYAIGTPKGMATCIVVNKPDPSAPRGVVPVLITAKHVLDAAPHGPYFLGVRTVDQNGNAHVAILEFAPRRSGGFIYTWHPQHDVAAIELRLPEEVAGVIDVPSFLDQNAIGRDEDQPRPGQEISVLGFPKVFPGTAGGFAVLRGGKIASYAPGDRRNTERFLVNTSAFSGDSGAPVFADAGGGRNPHLIGLLTDRIGKKAGEAPLAIAVNADVIRETLQLLDQHERSMSGTGSRGQSDQASPNQSNTRLRGSRASFIKIIHSKQSALVALATGSQE
ncbi:MAG: trypsin-like serine peptidase [Nitrospirota bacterium]